MHEIYFKYLVNIFMLPETGRVFSNDLKYHMNIETIMFTASMLGLFRSLVNFLLNTLDSGRGKQVIFSVHIIVHQIILFFLDSNIFHLLTRKNLKILP